MNQSTVKEHYQILILGGGTAGITVAIRFAAIIRINRLTTHLFAVEKYRKTLEKVAARKDIDVRLKHNLVELKPDSKEAIFEHMDTHEMVTIAFDMIHVTSPMSAPDIIKTSPLANATEWVDVDKYTLQHPKYPNVFPIGDCSRLPTSKTGAAIRKQAPFLVKNLLSAIKGEPLVAKYDGYTSCPIVTGYGKLVLAEFGYEGKPNETFPFDQSKERLSMYLLKAYALRGSIGMACCGDWGSSDSYRSDLGD